MEVEDRLLIGVVAIVILGMVAALILVAVGLVVQASHGC